MDVSDSFYEIDNTRYTFVDSKRHQESEQANIFSVNAEEPLKFGELGFEESIDLEKYLHLGNTPPNTNGDELLKQFGAYSSSPPVTVNVKTQAHNSQFLSQALDSLPLPPVHICQEASIVQPALSSSTATTTQLGFRIKQEIEEHSVPEFAHEINMPPGEEQAHQIAQGEQGNHLGGQQVYLTLKSLTAPHTEDVVTTSSAAEPYVQAYNIGADSKDPSNEGSNMKKRQRQALNKESVEYKTKRIRNNIAVRKSREKSKVRNNDLQSKVTSLQSENDKLNKKVELLTKELTVLRSLFTTVKPNSVSQQ